jgi:hypothetical protein
MTHLVTTPHGDFIVRRSLELAARVALALGGTVAPLLDVPPAPARVGVRAA